MEPTAGSGTADEARRHPTRAALASLTAIALLGAGVGLVAATRHHGAPPLVLTPGGRAPEKGTTARPSIDPGPMPWTPFRYVLAIPAPDLGSNAPVARLEAPPVDDARVRSNAADLGVNGVVERSPNGGRQVREGTALLILEPTPGGWALSYTRLSGGASSPGAVPGSGGSGGSGGSTIVPPVPLEPVSPPTTAPIAPANLPDAARAERIARALLERIGVTGEWSATADTTSTGGGVACAPEPCAVPDHIVLASRSVELHPRFNGIEIDGISWRVDIGDEGHILGVSGTWAELRTLRRYPLRSVAAVFGDLAAGRGIDPEPVPVYANDLGGAVPFPEIKPVTVTIDRVTLGLAVMPASDGGSAVVDVVPTYVFTGRTSSGFQVSRSLVAVEATVITPSTAPGSPTTVPNATNTLPVTTGPVGKPEPQPLPVSPPTVAGKPPT
jgi:hypothetical protein